MSKKVPITSRALLQRINRRLASEGERVKKLKSTSRMYMQWGPYYRLDTDRNALLEDNVDIVRLGRQLNALAEWETLAVD